MEPTPPLDIPATLNPAHGAILAALHFESAGTVAKCQGLDRYDGIRVVYAISNPEHTAVVYVGDSEIGGNLRGRLKDHLSRRDKAGKVERDSLVFVHVLITEFLVLTAFEEETGAKPELNHTKPRRFVNYGGRRIERRPNPAPGMSAVQQGERAYVERLVKGTTKEVPPPKPPKPRKASKKPSKATGKPAKPSPLFRI